jgi:hypothetical protein
VRCSVIDDGASSTRRLPGRGTEINDALAARLDGALSRTFGPRGSTVTLTFPRGRIAFDLELSPRSEEKFRSRSQETAVL